MNALQSLKPAFGARKKKKRVGRGESSGLGKTSSRGGKGQTARSGSKRKAHFEGGQTPLYRRIPKLGFTSQSRVREDNIYVPVNLDRLLARCAGVAEIRPEQLLEKGLIRTLDCKIKLLGGTEVSTPVNIYVHAVSQGARSRVESAGGKVELLS